MSQTQIFIAFILFIAYFIVNINTHTHEKFQIKFIKSTKSESLIEMKYLIFFIIPTVIGFILPHFSSYTKRTFASTLDEPIVNKTPKDLLYHERDDDMFSNSPSSSSDSPKPLKIFVVDTSMPRGTQRIQAVQGIVAQTLPKERLSVISCFRNTAEIVLIPNIFISSCQS